jgi:sugar O-acyltransferase (sialic acid O-acetyltransferase NeuD family)
MIILGAKGFAKELLEVFAQNNELEHIAFFDDISSDLSDQLYGRFTVLRDQSSAQAFMEKFGPDYCIGVGNPYIRERLNNKFSTWGGNLKTIVSKYANIGHYGNVIENGATIMAGTTITNDIKIGKGVLINLNCTIGHDSIIGAFSELSPGVHISGHCFIEDFVTIGTGAVIIPGIRIGAGSIVAAGSVVTKNVDTKMMVAGIPAEVKKHL